MSRGGAFPNDWTAWPAFIAQNYSGTIPQVPNTLWPPVTVSPTAALPIQPTINASSTSNLTATSTPDSTPITTPVVSVTATQDSNISATSVPAGPAVIGPGITTAAMMPILVGIGALYLLFRKKS